MDSPVLAAVAVELTALLMFWSVGSRNAVRMSLAAVLVAMGSWIALATTPTVPAARAVGVFSPLAMVRELWLMGTDPNARVPVLMAVCVALRMVDPALVPFPTETVSFSVWLWPWDAGGVGAAGGLGGVAVVR